MFNDKYSLRYMYIVLWNVILYHRNLYIYLLSPEHYKKIYNKWKIERFTTTKQKQSLYKIILWNYHIYRKSSLEFSNYKVHFKLAKLPKCRRHIVSLNHKMILPNITILRSNHVLICRPGMLYAHEQIYRTNSWIHKFCKYDSITRQKRLP